MAATQRLMLVEDDHKLAELLQHYFVEFGYEVSTLASGEGAAAKIIAEAPDLVILDLMLPDEDGLSICRGIRQAYAGKILMLTASGDDMDQVAALELGADDFVQKPIQPRVLLARIRMLLRREPSEGEAPAASDKELRFGQLWLNASLQRCTLREKLVALTPSEFQLLWHLASHPDTPQGREPLLRALSGLEYNGLNRTVDNKVAQLRKKLGDDALRPRGIITVRGKGYMFVPDYW